MCISVLFNAHHIKSNFLRQQESELELRSSPVDEYDGVLVPTDPRLPHEDVFPTGHWELSMCVCVRTPTF